MSNESKRQHGISDLDEARHVRASDVVARRGVLLGGFQTPVMDGPDYLGEPLFGVLERP